MSALVDKEYRARCSAPGKVILFGEHAVVHGVTAVAAALSDLRIFIDISVTSVDAEAALCVFFDDMIDSSTGEPTSVVVCVARIQGVSCDPSRPVLPDETSQRRLASLFESQPTAICQGMMAISYLVSGILPEFVCGGHKLVLRIQSHGLPIGAGLGSSASFAVALAGACIQLREIKTCELHGRDWSTPPESVLDVINAWAFAAEMLIHGQPSGLDNTTSCYGGLVKFRKGENPFEKVQDSGLSSLRILLTNTKIPRSTKALVGRVNALYEAHPGVVTPVFAAIEDISLQFLHAVSQNEEEKNLEEIMMRLMTINHHLLCSLGVGHPALTQVEEISRAFGCASKLTGAGGGGCAITLLPRGSEKVAELQETLRSKGFDTFQSAVGGDGVRWHSFSPQLDS